MRITDKLSCLIIVKTQIVRGDFCESLIAICDFTVLIPLITLLAFICPAFFARPLGQNELFQSSVRPFEPKICFRPITEQTILINI